MVEWDKHDLNLSRASNPAVELPVRNKDTLHRAVYVSTGFVFLDGPVKQTYPEGAVLLTDGKYVWGIDRNVFIRNFKRSDSGQEIDLLSLEDELGRHD